MKRYRYYIENEYGEFFVARKSTNGKWSPEFPDAMIFESYKNAASELRRLYVPFLTTLKREEITVEG